MKKTVLALVGVAVVALVAILGWYFIDTHRAEARSNDFEAWAKNQKAIAIEFVVTAPKDTTPAGQTLYLSGGDATLGAWDAAGVPMEKRDDGKYHASVELMSGIEHAFKVTRGTWGTVERGAANAEIANHTFTADKPQAVEATVIMWVDEGKAVPGRVTLTGTFQQHKKFHSSNLNNERTIIVYLPPGYEDDANKDMRYPVLYMNDGNNLFDESTSFAGVEWKMDETAQKLIEGGKIAPAIIVGIFNSEQRNEEFTPPGLSTDKIKGRGDQYAKFVVEEVKPMIDKTYRTQPDRAHTSLGGSSMGGLIALYTLKTNHDTFGQIAVLTPWLREGSKTLLSELGADGAWARGTRLYLDMGSAGGTNYPGEKPIDDARELEKTLESAGLSKGNDLAYTEIEGGQHTETAWATRVEPMLVFLYGK